MLYEVITRFTPCRSTGRSTVRSPPWEAQCTRRPEAAEAEPRAGGEAPEGGAGEEAEEAGDPLQALPSPPTSYNFV